MNAHDVLLANADAMKRGALAIWTIYNRPRDHRQGFIARMYEVGRSGPRATDKTIVHDEVDTIRGIFRQAGLTPLARDQNDEPQIVESWV